MAATFPTTPSNGQIAEVGGRFYTYNSTIGAWENTGSASANLATAANITVTGNANITTLNASTANITGQLNSNIATGTAPITVTSTTRIANINVATAGNLITGTSNVIVNSSANVTISSAGNANILNVTGTGTITTGQANIASGNLNILTQNYLKLFDLDSTHYVSLQSPATVSANVGWTLPSTDGSNLQCIATNGAGALSFRQTIGQVNVVVLTSGTSATYTPTAGTKYVEVTVIGGGGGGGFARSQDGSALAHGGGGAGGGTAIKFFTLAQLGATATYTVGSAGTGGTTGAVAATAGGNSVFTPSGTGSALTANGGGGGTGLATGGQTSPAITAGGAGGTATGGDINISGEDGEDSIAFSNSFAKGGNGGGSLFIANSHGSWTSTTSVGAAATNYGTGGSGAASINQNNATVGIAGANGASGVIIIREFIS